MSIHLPPLLISKLLTFFQILHGRDDHGRMFRRCHELVARTIVLGETRVLSVGTFVGFGMVQALSPGQRELTQVRDDPIELAFIPFFKLVLERFEGNSSYRLSRKHQRFELLFELVVINFSVLKRHFRAHMIQVRHHIRNAHAVVNHGCPYHMSELMRFEMIHLPTFPHNWPILGNLIEMGTKPGKPVESSLGPKEVAFAKDIRYLLDELPLPLYRFSDLGGDRKRSPITLHFVIVPEQARITRCIVIQAILSKMYRIFCSKSRHREDDHQMASIGWQQMCMSL